MKHRSVVANFLFRWTNLEHTQQQVALFHRSHHPNIRSYQGKYSPISGSIEDEDEDPLQAAKREIQEETQLTPDHDIILEFCGKSYSFQDEQAGRSWTVHPFGWILKANEDTIKIDWEHDSWAWFEPQEALDGSRNDECVPKLDKSLQRVFFGPNGMFRSGYQVISRGNTAGSKFLETIEQIKQCSSLNLSTPGVTALKGLHSIAECFTDHPTEGAEPPDYWHALSVAAFHFIHSAQPTESSKIGPYVLAALEEVAKTLERGALDPTVASTILESHVDDNKTDRVDVLRTDASERAKVEGRLFNDLYDI